MAFPASVLAELNDLGPHGPAIIRRWAAEQPEIKVGYDQADPTIALYDVELVKGRVRKWRAWHQRAAARAATRSPGR